MVAIGAVMGGSSGFNPIELMQNVVGKEQMTECVNDMMHFPLRFPDPTEEEVVAAEQAVLAVGIGFTDQDTALNNFLQKLSPEKQQMVQKIQTDVFDKMMGALIDEKTGEPSERMVAEIKKEMHDMEEKAGNSDGMPQEFKQLVEQKEKNVNADLLASAQALIALKPDVSKKFDNLLPLVNQAVLYSTIALPMAKKAEAKKSSNFKASLEESALIGLASSSTELDLPPANTIREAMVSMGELLSNGNGYNPVVLFENVLGGEAEMDKWMDTLMKLPTRLPEPTQEEVDGAQNVLLMYGLGFESEEQAIDHFMKTLTPETRAVVEDVQNNVVDKLTNAMMNSDGTPSTALVEEIKRQMREMQNRTGNTDMMPAEIKAIVAPPSAAAITTTDTAPTTETTATVEVAPQTESSN